MAERSLFRQAVLATSVATALGSAVYATQTNGDLSTSAQGRITVEETQSCPAEDWDACFSIGPVPGIISIGVTGDAVITDTSKTIPAEMAKRHQGDTTINFAYVEDDGNPRTHLTAQCFSETDLKGERRVNISEGEHAQLLPYEPSNPSKDGGVVSCTVFEASAFSTHTPRPTQPVEATPVPAGIAYLPKLDNN